MITRNCTFDGDREDRLVGYLYEELEPHERASFESHLEECGACRQEISELQAARRPLAAWQPPERVTLPGAPPADFAGSRRWWHDVPVWAQAAAAVLVVGVGAGAANLDIRYDAAGLSVRTGWLAPRIENQTPPQAAQSAPWTADLTALGRQLRSEMTPATDAAVRPVSARTPASADDAVKQVRALVAESERRQQRELALRVAEVLRDVQQQRQSDLVKIDRNLGIIQNNTGVEVMRQRQLLNSLAVRVSQKQ